MRRNTIETPVESGALSPEDALFSTTCLNDNILQENKLSPQRNKFLPSLGGSSHFHWGTPEITRSNDAMS